MTYVERWLTFARSTWHLVRVFVQLIHGAWRMSHIPQPIITIFGSARLAQANMYTKNAHDLALRFVTANISVATGGGPGIMEAANCGALSYPGVTYAKSIGIAVRELNEPRNMCVQEYLELDYFFARKWLLTRYSVGFIVFPGGFGTLDELFEIITLIQTKKMAKLPIILIGSTHWKSFVEWISTECLKQGVLRQEELDIITVTDDLDYAFCLMRDECTMDNKKSYIKKG